jgi:hypothetical protein
MKIKVSFMWILRYKHKYVICIKIYADIKIHVEKAVLNFRL